MQEAHADQKLGKAQILERALPKYSGKIQVAFELVHIGLLINQKYPTVLLLLTCAHKVQDLFY